MSELYLEVARGNVAGCSTVRKFGRSDGGFPSPDFVFSVPLALPEKTDLKWVATVDNNNTNVYVQYNLILIDHSATLSDWHEKRA